VRSFSYYKRRVLAKLWVLTSIFVLAIATFDLGAIGASEPQAAPLNPAFEEYMQLPRTVRPPALVTPEGYYLGHIPGPVDLSHLLVLREPPQAPLSQPAAYDLRVLGEVTPVRDQANCGACWAFATKASLESWLLKVVGETWDLSENNLKECHGFTWGPCDGGDFYISTAYLGRRDGPIAEADDPYYDYATGCASGLPVRKYLREVSIYSNVTRTKNEIMTHGAMYTAFYWGSNYYDPATYSYYYSGAETSNHAVAIVGWDDSKVVSGAPGNGAWICKNNWGTGWGEAGYFYLSYFDKYAVGNSGFAMMFWDARDTECSTVYQYDPLGWVNDVGYPPATTAWGANVFTTTQAGYLTRVAFYTNDASTGYNVYIKRGGPDGTVAHNQSGTFTDPGYHTVDLTTPVSLSNGETFTVVVEFNNPTYDYPIASECAVVGYSDAATANPGESYVSPSGALGSWFDLTGMDATANVCIKAIIWPAAQATTSVFRVNDLGCVFADKNICGQGLSTGQADVAEWVPVSEPVEPGDVLELDPENPGHYRKSRGPCSSLVAGVVSTAPGFVLGSQVLGSDTGLTTDDSRLVTDDSALLALLGIVPVKVTAEGGPIQPGDLLVVSSTQGVAMRWDPDTDRTCSLVGKALGPLETGTGVIQVLLMR